jgi:hypothetical protein
MAAHIQESICLGLAQVSADYDQECLREEAHSTLAWLRTPEVRDWHNTQLIQHDPSFVVLLEWIAEETRRIGQADGYFITLNYVVSLSFPPLLMHLAHNLTTSFVCRNTGHLF